MSEKKDGNENRFVDFIHRANPIVFVAIVVMFICYLLIADDKRTNEERIENLTIIGLETLYDVREISFRSEDYKLYIVLETAQGTFVYGYGEFEFVQGEGAKNSLVKVLHKGSHNDYKILVVGKKNVANIQSAFAKEFNRNIEWLSEDLDDLGR